MLASPSLRVRARLAVAAVVVVLTGIAAAPAGAQTEGDPERVSVLEVLSGGDQEPSGRFESPLTALLRAMYRAERAAAGSEPAAEDAEVAVVRSCLEAGPGDADVPTMVAAIFRCRLTEAGIDELQVRQWSAEAVVVSHCESLWDPGAVVFDGRYRDVPHPNGNRYSAAGVFQFIRKTADRWIEGGYAEVHDPRRNVDAAARLFIHNRNAGLRGWEDWACAAANDGFKVGSVLAGWPGGPAELPAWAWQY